MLRCEKEKVDSVNKGCSYIGDVAGSDLNILVGKGMLSATTDFRALDKADFVVICVPTPLDARRQPDISYVESSVKSVAEYLRKGMMVVLESTTYPGTTEELVKPILESTGLKKRKRLLSRVLSGTCRPRQCGLQYTEYP